MAAFKNIKLLFVPLRIFLNKTPSSLQLNLYRFKYNEAYSVKSVLLDHPVGSDVVVKVYPTKLKSCKLLHYFNNLTT